MIKYSIADLENLTGIKAHTIRIWEKRYNLIKPFRTSTNIRYYDNEQMKKLINVTALIRSGMKISKVSELSVIQIADEINKRLSDAAQSGSGNFEVFTAQLINFGAEFDENGFNRTYSNAILHFGLNVAYERILLPLLNRIGLFWSTNRLNPAQEHFVSNLIKQKLYAAIDGLPPAISASKPTILFLPHDESHEIGLLMAKYVLRSSGRRVIYLGQNVPVENLKSTVENSHPDQLLFFLIQIHPLEKMQKYIDRISSEFMNKKLFVAGLPYFLSNLDIPNNVTWISSPMEFNQML